MAYSTNQVNKFVFIPLQSSEGMETYVDLSTVTKASFAHMSGICPLTIGILEPSEDFSPEKPIIFSLYTPNKESKIPYQIHFNMNVGISPVDTIKEYQRINKLLKPFNIWFLPARGLEFYMLDPAVEIYCNQGVIHKESLPSEYWEEELSYLISNEEIAEGITPEDLGVNSKTFETFILKRISAFANFADGFSNDQMFGVGYPYTDFPAKLSNIDEIHVNIPIEDWPSYVAFALECDYQGTGEDTQKSHMVYQGFMPIESAYTLSEELASKNIPIILTGLGGSSGEQ